MSSKDNDIRRRYRCIDEVNPSMEDGIPAPWSPNSVFLFTIFGGSLIGGLMAMLNVERLRIPEEKRKTLMVFLGSIAIPITIWLLERFTVDPEFIYILRFVASLTNYAAGYYYYNTQVDAFGRYIDQKGKGKDDLRKETDFMVKQFEAKTRHRIELFETELASLLERRLKEENKLKEEANEVIKSELEKLKGFYE